jgi:hypothetical protein
MLAGTPAIMLQPPRSVLAVTLTKSHPFFALNFQNPLTCMYLTQPTFMENLKISILIFFEKKVVPN